MWKQVYSCIHDNVITHLAQLDDKTPQTNKTTCTLWDWLEGWKWQVRQLKYVFKRLWWHLHDSVYNFVCDCDQWQKQLIHTKTNLQNARTNSQAWHSNQHAKRRPLIDQAKRVWKLDKSSWDEPERLLPSRGKNKEGFNFGGCCMLEFLSSTR